MNRFRKVIVIGLDGLEPTLTEAMLERGELPNLAGLKAQGSYQRVRTTYPAQTPVAWSTFATGTNPGAHGIFDFITRDPKTYLPTLALNHYEQKNIFVQPRVVNGRHGVPVWEILTRERIPCTILRHPLTFPPDPVSGHMLAGVGVPDLRGGLGSYTFYTSDANVTAQQDEKLVHVSLGSDRTIFTFLPGPRNPKTRSEFRLDLIIRQDLSANKVAITMPGESRALEVHAGKWSEWLKVNFHIAPLVSLKGMVRFYLLGQAPIFELFASPINFVPDAPMFPISYPPGYAQELEKELGTFTHWGWRKKMPD